MYKTIGLSIFYLLLFLGLYGCSCSESPKTVNKEAGLYVADATVNEEDDGVTEYKVAVNLQRENQDAVTVNYSVSAIAVSPTPVATAGEDFETATGTLTFEPESGDTQYITFNVINDTLYEHDEDFLITLTAASGARVVSGEAVVTIKDNDPKPVASMKVVSDLPDTSFAENAVDIIEIEVSLDKVSGVDAELRVLEDQESETDPNSVGKTAAYRVDYILEDANSQLMQSPTFSIPAGETSTVLNVQVIDDGIVENTESFTLALQEEADVNPAGAKLTFSIVDNDEENTTTQVVVPLNDSGITKPNAVLVTVDDLPPDLTTEEIQSQSDLLVAELQKQMDYAIGRDAAYLADTLTKVGGGRAGFDFTRLDSEGKEVTVTLAEGQSIADIDLTWDCVRDNNTGLVWEVKTRGNLGLRAAGRSFYWYDPNYETNGGVSGKKGEFTCDENELTTCNTSYYVADINARKLCGLTGWRVPTLDELRSIIDYNTGGQSDSAAYDTDYFAGDTIGVYYYWTSTTYAPEPSRAWAIRFRSGSGEEPRDKSTQAVTSSLRLVNDSLIKQAQQ